MSNFIAISPNDTHGKGWTVPENLLPFKTKSLIPILAHEAGKLASSVPLAIYKNQLVAVCGTRPDDNLFIDMKGQWMGNVEPQWLSTYPFFLFSVGDKAIPCFDTDSGWLTSDTEGEPFFASENQFNTYAEQRVKTIMEIHPKKVHTDKVVKALLAAKVLSRWPQHFIDHYQILHTELYMLDEKALSQVSDETFLELRSIGGVALAYAMSFSLNQHHILERLNRMHGVAKEDVTEDLDALFGGEDDTLKFNF